MMVPLFAAAAALGYAIWRATKTKVPKGTPGNYLPPKGNQPIIDPNAKPVIPKDAVAPKLVKTQKLGPARDNRIYTTSRFKANSKGEAYVLVQLNGSSGWLGYYHNEKTGARKLYKAYAKGDRDQSGRIVSVMMSDWGVKK